MKARGRPSAQCMDADPHALGTAYRATLGKQGERLGAFYTPPPIAAHIANQTLDLLPPGLPRVLDPACGCGAFLVEVLRALVQRGVRAEVAVCEGLLGLDSDPGAVGVCRQAVLLAARQLGGPDAARRRAVLATERNIRVADALLEPPAEQFDCVVGNPPYVRAARDCRGRRARLRQLYESAVGAFDLYVPFFELCLRLVRPGGALGLLTSNKWLVADYAARLRQLLARSAEIVWLVDLADAPHLFPGPLVSSLITVARKSSPSPSHALRYTAATATTRSLDTLTGQRRLQRELLAGEEAVATAPPEALAVMRQMQDGGQRLEQIAQVRGGVMGFDYHKVCRYLQDSDGRPGARRVLCPGNVRRYETRWGRRVKLGGQLWHCPALTEGSADMGEALWAFFRQPKIVVKGVGRTVSAAFDARGSVLLVALWGVTDFPGPPEALLALLNSEPINWLHRQQLYAARIPRGSFRFPLSWVKQIPVPPDTAAALAEAGAARLAAADDEARARTELVINQIVCDLYGLAPAERRPVLAPRGRPDIPVGPRGRARHSCRAP